MRYINLLFTYLLTYKYAIAVVIDFVDATHHIRSYLPQLQICNVLLFSVLISSVCDSRKSEKKLFLLVTITFSTF